MADMMVGDRSHAPQGLASFGTPQLTLKVAFHRIERSLPREDVECPSQGRNGKEKAAKCKKQLLLKER